MDGPNRIAQRFPLVARARPACPPLDERIGEVGELARAAAGQTGADRLPMAATAHNKAALIASDCGLPDLAQALCWQQFDLYQCARPLTGQAARFALEPVVNLARLLIRGGDGEAAHQLLDTLYQAVRFRTDAVIDGRQVSFRDLTGSDDDHRDLCQWLWTVLLADGTRALASAGRWDQALTHVEQRGGIGRRLLDGRQATILARCFAGDPASALALVEESANGESWEHPVAACLTVLCLRYGSRPADSAIAAMVKHYLDLEPTPGLVVFRTRLGLTAIDLASGVDHPNVAQAADRLLREVVTTGDGYAARDVLEHKGCSVLLTETQERALSTAVRSSGLDQGSIPTHLMADLQAAIKVSENAARRNLAALMPASPSL
jgi:hypothetical protein